MSCRRLASSTPLLVALLLSGCPDPHVVSVPCKTGSKQACTCGGTRPGVFECIDGTLSDCRCDAVTAGDGGNDASEPADAQSPDATVDAAAGAEDAQKVMADAGAVNTDSGVDVSCGSQTSEATIKDPRSVDVIFVIDNSGSMSDEIQAVEANINDSFARIVDASGVDYRVIMVSHHGSAASQQICIKAPLSGTNCSPIPSVPVNGPRFFHYDRDIQSTDSWCLLLDTFDLPDTHGLTTTGWQAWLRPTALKVFVEISDDGISCSSTRGSFSQSSSGAPVDDALKLSLAFNDALLTLSPQQFGTKQKPNYVWHSVVGLKPNTPPELPWLPAQPMQTETCSTAYNPGAGYQMLSVATGGLRYPVCEGAGFSNVFRAIAGDVVEGSGVECRFRIPAAPVGKYVDKASIAVAYTPSSGGAVQNLRKVEANNCSDSAFVIEGEDVVLCDAACTRVRQDKTAKLRVVYGCAAPDVVH